MHIDVVIRVARLGIAVVENGVADLLPNRLLVLGASDTIEIYEGLFVVPLEDPVLCLLRSAEEEEGLKMGLKGFYFWINCDSERMRMDANIGGLSVLACIIMEGINDVEGAIDGDSMTSTFQ